MTILTGFNCCKPFKTGSTKLLRRDNALKAKGKIVKFLYITFSKDLKNPWLAHGLWSIKVRVVVFTQSE